MTKTAVALIAVGAVLQALVVWGEAGLNKREVFAYEKPDRSPIWFGGESRCEGVDPGGEYSVFLDVFFADGSHAWALQAMFQRGTHGWLRSERLYIPPRPVEKIHLYRMLRGTSGTAEFRGVFLKRERPQDGHVLSERRFSMRPFLDADRVDRTVVRRGKPVRETGREPSSCAAQAGLAETVIWTADSMVKISPSAVPVAAQLESRSIDLELAGAESESAQICVTAPAGAKEEAIEISVGSIASASGAAFPGSVDVRRVGYLAKVDGFDTHPHGDDPHELWFPELLLPVEGIHTSPGGTQSAWLTFSAMRGAKAGLYKGAVQVRVGDVAARIPVRLRVRDFSLPERFGMNTAFSVMDGFTKAAYPDDFESKKRESWDIMLDHRLNPTDISRTSPPNLDDVAYAVKRGMSSFCVLNLVPPNPKRRWVCRAKPGEVFNDEFRTYVDHTLSPYVAALRRRGLDDGAYLYGFDECGGEYFRNMESMWKDLKSAYGIPVMTTAKMFGSVAAHALEFGSPEAMAADIHCPPLDVYDALLADRYRASGRRVWWYTCCSPRYPYLNVAPYAHPVVECRLVGWLTKLVRADGFLYWHVNYWKGDGKLDERETFFPDWRTDTWKGAHGDGVFIYPGLKHIVSGIRLANIRDGVEDYEWLDIASRKVGRNKVESLIREVAKSVKDFSRDPAALRQIRTRIADICEQGPLH